MNRLSARAFMALVALATAGCSGFSSKAGGDVTYTLRSSPPAATAASKTNLAALTLQIVQPVAGPGLDGDAILLSTPDRRLGRYAASRWSAPVPGLVASLAAETLRNRTVLAAVHDDAAPFPSDYILRISIRRFDADQGEGAPMATVVLDCNVGTRVERKLLATFVAEARVPAAENRMSAVVSAFEQAARIALGQVADQTLAALSAEAAD